MAKSHKQPAQDCEVGKGKPPEHTQFQPGKSGNPSGSSKKARAKAKAKAAAAKPVLDTIVAVLREEVSVGDGAKKDTMPLLEVFVKKAMRDALVAPARDRIAIIAAFKKLGVLDAYDFSIMQDECKAQEEGEKLTGEELRFIENAMQLADVMDEEDRRHAELYRQEHGLDKE